MSFKRSYYIIEIQYLGFRFHGWQKQPEVNTVQRMIERTLSYVLEHKKFKTLAAGRTDAKVSVNQTYIELYLDEKPLDVEAFLPLFNKNLPQDIKALSIVETDEKFNIIQHPKVKEYMYLFSFGEKNHPFAAPFMVNFDWNLNLSLMQKAVKLFEGEHDFRNYCYKPTEKTITQGTILTSEIIENTIYLANFFPEKSYILRVRGEGFKRNQIRLIMARLIQLGKGEYTFEEIENSLNLPNVEFPITYIAPPSGLILNKVDLVS
ncbi:MAG: tRNA pseudouridine(38-40) synthase TruA [Flavobacteriaceae bacterium]|nr:tRNA pseudouridine(38-40) synthase TruA [Flavobacteriaceae bacterium]